MPLVSLIIPAYNAANWIEEAIRSGLKQTWSDVEVLVVDDGSTDETAALAAATLDQRVRVIRQENRGQSAAINRGVLESRGAYVKILDADDWINPEHLESQLLSLAHTKECVSSCGWGYFVHSPVEATRREEQADRDYDNPLEWLVDSLEKDEGMMGGWKWLIPRTVWERSGGYDERLSLNNDFDFSIRLVLASRGVMFAREALYAYRKGQPGALSGSKGPKAMKSAFLTTESGCAALLAREDSTRIRRICADRWQNWMFQFYPDYPDLAAEAERRIGDLGGSGVRMGGGRVLRILEPLIGWKGVRLVQAWVYRTGWRRVLRWKAQRRLSLLGDASRAGGSVLGG